MSREALLRRICAEPDNIDARLVYADWLEEYGSDEDRVRAEVIRLQCELADWKPYVAPLEIAEIADSGRLYSSMARAMLATKEKEHNEKREAMLSRSRLLLNTRVPHGHMNPQPERGWLWAGEPLQAMYPCGYTYRRGFVEEVRTTCGEWRNHGSDVVSRHPIRVLALTDKTPFHDSDSSFVWISDLSAAPVHWHHAVIPQEIYALVEPREHYLTVHFPSFDSALDSIAEAALRWARQEDTSR